MYARDTIAAISTSLAEAAVGIVRISGEAAITIAESLFQGASARSLKELGSHSIAYGFVVDPLTRERVDEALFTLMRKPRSYTREDVVEINCHGGMQVLKRTLEIVLRQGARMAEPGEFTKRAFLNGRIDLAQAEAVIDVIRAPTPIGLKLALGQLRGRLSGKIREIRDTLLEIRTDLEATVDFPEEDIGPPQREKHGRALGEGIGQIEDMLSRAPEGRIYRHGVETAIAGRPNVGKSSILNALVREERAIVTPMAGTTRDIIEEIVSVRGIPLRLRDTAGIRKPQNRVEEIGVGLSKRAIEEADLVLCVLDQSVPLASEDRELIGEIRKKKAVVVANKRDLPCRINEKEMAQLVGKTPVVKTSALTGEGLAELEDAIEERVFKGRPAARENTVTCNLRHQQALEKALNYLKEARAALAGKVSEEIVCSSLAEGQRALGEILGEATTEDLLDRIFSKFCIGK